MLGRHYTEFQMDHTFSSTSVLQHVATAIQQVAWNSLGDARTLLDILMDYQGEVVVAMMHWFDAVSKAWTEIELLRAMHRRTAVHNWAERRLQWVVQIRARSSWVTRSLA